MLRGVQETQTRRLEHIKVLTDSLTLVQALVRNIVPFQLVSTRHDIVEIICKKIRSYIIIKVDRGLVGESHVLTTQLGRVILY